jgi:arylsulfatase A-like enzyme
MLGRRLLFLLALASASAGCERFRGPLSLLQRPAQGGAPRTGAVTCGGETRPALLSSASFELVLPARGLLTFGMGVQNATGMEPSGWYRLTVRSGPQVLADKRLNPRESHGWRDVSQELTGLGRRATLTFELRLTDKDDRPRETPPGLVLAVSDPVVHDLDDYGQAKGILFVSIDTLRRDHVGAYGYSKPTTPRLDALAREGILAEDAVSTSSWTLPAHLSMMTSVDPGVHGGTNMHAGFNRCVPTLASLLHGAGYATQAVTSHLYMSARYGMDMGFDHLEFDQEFRAPRIADLGRNLLDRFGDRPFFVFLHFYDPHWHYDPHESTTHLFETDYHGTLGGKWADFKDLDPKKVPPADMAHLLALYDGEIRFTDDEVGGILDHLHVRGLDKSTLVVVASDHGEEFGEHGSWEHQKTLYEELIRVPVIVRGPGVTPRHEKEPVSLLDIAPTIVAWAGLTPKWQPQGISLLSPIPHRETYGETDHTIDKTRKLFVRDGAGRSKAIFSLTHDGHTVEREEWYDLASDGGETRTTPPRGDVGPQVRSRAITRWCQDRAGCGHRYPANLSPDDLEQMRQLGYVFAVDDTIHCPEKP